MSNASAKCSTLMLDSIEPEKPKTSKADLLHVSLKIPAGGPELERTVGRAPGLGTP